MPEPIVPNPPAVPEGGAPSGGQPQPSPTPPSKFAELKQKKGFKDEEAFAVGYEEAEKQKSRLESTHGKIKQQLETAGYTINDNGDVVPIGQQGHQGYPPQGPQPGQGYPPQGGYPPQAEPVYDPYTGTIITDPVALQLARMPVGHREAFVFNAMLEQREKQQSASYQAEAEVLSVPEAKGFEEDVRKVMQTLPLAVRADKKQWSDALLRVKGARYDQAMKNAGQQGVDAFINKENIQPLPGSGGPSGAGTTLTPEQEQTYRYYQQNHPGMFKDKAHFLRANQPGGGR